MDKVREKTDQKLQRIEEKIQENPRKTLLTLLTLTILTATTTALLTLPQTDNVIQKKNLSEDLVLHYKFESGNTEKVIDSSGNNHTGVIHGDPRHVRTEDGLAMKFDGEDDYISVNFSRNIAESGFTQVIEFYSKNSSWGRSKSGAGGRWVTAIEGQTAGIYINGASNKAAYRYYGDNGVEGRIEAGEIHRGKEHSLEVTYNEENSLMKVYLDGRKASSRKINDLEEFDGLRIGGRNNYWYTGQVRSFKIYDSPDKIQKGILAFLISKNENVFTILFALAALIGGYFIDV